MWFRNKNVVDHSVDLGVDKRIRLKWILKKEGGKGWTVCFLFVFYA